MTTTKNALVRTLLECGADHAFTLPGLGVTWMLDEFYEVRDRFRVVLSRSEQIASVMAQTYGKLTGRPGVFMGQGPFASTTGAFGILEAQFAGSPMVVLTDTSCYDGFGMYGVYQTMTGDYGAADVRTVLGTMTKYTAYATEPHEAVYGLQLAFKHAQLPRMGPAALVLKTPIIRREMPEQTRVKLYPSDGYLRNVPARPDADAIGRLASMVAAARQPVIIAGQGTQSDAARALVAKIAGRAGIGVATSYNGKGVVDETSPFALGMLGTWGCRAANRMLGKADLVLAIGASLGPDYLRFRDDGLIDPARQKIAQIDVDARHAGWVYPVDLAITADAADALALLDGHDLGDAQRDARIAAIAANNAEHGYGVLPPTVAADGTLHYADIVRALDRSLTPKDMLVLDAGNNRIWVTSSLRMRTPGQLVAPGGVGGMGWGMPAAAATRLVYPDRHAVCLIGDGGMAMTLSTLATCVQERLPITVVVANNRGLGMVRDNMKGKRIAVDFTDLDFATIARGFGCHGVRVDRADALGDALAQSRERILRDGQAALPTVIDVSVDPAASHVPVSEQAADGLGLVLAVEVLAAEVVVLDAIAQHVEGGGEHRGGHGEDGFLGAAARLDAQELGAQVAVLDAHGSPGGGDQGRFDPGAALAHAGGATLAGALVAARTQPGPGHEMAGAGEARHVHADLRHHDAGRQVRDPGHRRQQAGALLDRRQRFSHGRVQLAQRALQGIDHLQVQPQHRAVVFGDASAQRLAQLGGLVARRAQRQRGQARGVGFAGHDGIEHRAPALAQHVRQHAAELEVGVLQHLLDAQRVLGDLPHQLLAGAGEVAQLLDGLRRHY